jgi:hypothetical protein
MRVSKEVASLSKRCNVHFLGIGKYSHKNFAKEYCEKFVLINGKRNAPGTMYKFVREYLKLNNEYKYDSLHFVNEQTYIFFYLFTLNKYIVLDLFDSIFLTLNKPGNKLGLLKRIIYFPVNRIIVTDQNRFYLLNSSAQRKAVVLPNFPYRVPEFIKKTSQEKIVILYNGTMNTSRGTTLIMELLKRDSNLEVIMAGWITDQETHQLCNHERVHFKGVIKQEEALRIAAEDTDYILCVYAPITDNNINASPNKIYDAIQCNTPVIINREIKVSSYVEENNLGVVLDSYFTTEYDLILKKLHEFKPKWNFDKRLKLTTNWEAVEPVLLKAHKIVD